MVRKRQRENYRGLGEGFERALRGL